MKKEYRVQGPPGCGKTYYIGRQVEHAAGAYGARNVVVCSLTRSAAANVASAAKEIPRENIGTLHALAYRAVNAGDIAETKAEQFNEYCAQNRQPTMKLSAGVVEKVAKDDDIVEPVTNSEETLGDRNYSDMNRLRAKMRPREMWPESVRSFATLWDHWKRDAGIMDFTDLLEVSLRDVAECPGKPAALFGDESQDCSRLAFALLRKWGECALRFIHVGDPDQILYAWAGVERSAFFESNLPPEQIKTLSQSYRVPRAVHAHAVRWIGATPGRAPVEYRPRDFEGKVRRDVNASVNYPTRAIEDAKRKIDEGKTVMFAASCSYMLTRIIGELRNRGIPFHNPYRTSRGDWNPLARRGTSAVARLIAFAKANPKFCPPDATPSWTWGDVAKWCAWIKAKGVMVRGAKAAIERAGKEREHEPIEFMDFVRLFDEAHWESITDADLLWFGRVIPPDRNKQLSFPVRILTQGGIEALETEPPCIVTTIHAAKGGESDVVYLFPDLSPQGHSEWMGSGEGKEGVRRAYYVGATRAREELVICQPATNMSVRI